ncbi:integrin alpha [Thiolapillus sp.]|uniref:integrin alpha n=1 Tax=Thiolapillus sp. TaxID=2017437 RepID=UPI003AF600C7
MLLDAEGNPLSTSQEDDWFGLTLAAADLDADGSDDLLVAAPYDTHSGIDNSGAVFLMYGARNGFLDGRHSELLTQGTSPDQLLGKAIATGQFDSDQNIDVVVGAPGSAVSCQSGAGEVIFLRNSGISPPGTGRFPFYQPITPDDVAGITAEVADLFGASLTMLHEKADKGCGDIDIDMDGIPNDIDLTPLTMNSSYCAADTGLIGIGDINDQAVCQAPNTAHNDVRPPGPTGET